jgi:hypothetical protein
MAVKSKIYGPYKGSKQNGGRPIYVKRSDDGSGKWDTSTSTNKARKDFKDSGGKVTKGQDVDHKNNNHSDDSKGNLRAISKSENVAKENKRRAKKS